MVSLVQSLPLKSILTAAIIESQSVKLGHANSCSASALSRFAINHKCKPHQSDIHKHFAKLRCLVRVGSTLNFQYGFEPMSMVGTVALPLDLPYSEMEIHRRG